MNVRMRGEGNVKDPQNTPESAVEMSNPMEGLVESEAAEESAPVEGDGLLSKLAEAVDEGVKEDLRSADNKGVSEIMAEEDRIFLKKANESTPEVEEPKIIDSTKATIDELLPESGKDGFDDSQKQDARYDSGDEGGVTKPNRTTGPMKSSDPALEGGQVKTREPLADSNENVYEVSGFHVEMSSGDNMVSHQVTADFKDLETAKACVNNTIFLMPLKEGGVKACKITRGAPIICFNERQLLEYVGGVWRKP